MPNKASADSFLDTLHNCPSSVKFTMDVENNSFIPFVGVELINVAPRIETRVYTKPTKHGLLVHYQNHVDSRYKCCLITTMLYQAYWLSSDWSYFSQECDRLKDVFSKLKYPQHLFNSAVKGFIDYLTSSTLPCYRRKPAWLESFLL